MSIARIGLDCLQAQEPWIFLPRTVEFHVSADGNDWREVGRVVIPVEAHRDPTVRMLAVEANGTRGRYVRVVARNQTIPEWHPGAGEAAWIFVDELIVEEA